MAITTELSCPRGIGSNKSPEGLETSDSTSTAACAEQPNREEDDDGGDAPEVRGSPSPSIESGEASEADENAGPPLPDEPIPVGLAQPPLPSEPLPGARPQTEEQEDDGWEYHWNPNTESYWFYNRYSQVWQQENPRLATGVAATAVTTTAAAMGSPPPLETDTGLSAPGSVANGYNPAIHGDYDPNAWYAQEARAAAAAAEQQKLQLQAQLQTGQVAEAAGGAMEQEYTSGALFNTRTGQWQTSEQGPERHSDESKSRRQMNAYFDVDAAANMHDGRSLKAERAGKKPTRSELKAFKEKRKAKKEEKRRAWLRD